MFFQWVHLTQMTPQLISETVHSRILALLAGTLIDGDDASGKLIRGQCFFFARSRGTKKSKVALSQPLIQHLLFRPNLSFETLITHPSSPLSRQNAGCHRYSPLCCSKNCSCRFRPQSCPFWRRKHRTRVRSSSQLMLNANFISFVAEFLHKSGYEVVFLDVVDSLIEQIQKVNITFSRLSSC